DVILGVDPDVRPGTYVLFLRGATLKAEVLHSLIYLGSCSVTDLVGGCTVSTTKRGASKCRVMEGDLGVLELGNFSTCVPHSSWDPTPNRTPKISLIIFRGFSEQCVGN
ncbi:hypothetical protein HAX54_050407, partial [Datura stramonium]|nr:hypothetical protein [Datura stramonium]